MEQDDKVSAAALSSGSVLSTGRGGRVSMRDAVQADGADASFGGGTARAPVETETRSLDDEGSDTFERVDHQRDKSSSKTPKKANNVRRIRIERMMSKAELARRANLSVLTIDRVERGYGCRMDTKRKILEALGLSLADRVRVFGEEE